MKILSSHCTKHLGFTFLPRVTNIKLFRLFQPNFKGRSNSNQNKTKTFEGRLQFGGRKKKSPSRLILIIGELFSVHSSNNRTLVICSSKQLVLRSVVEKISTTVSHRGGLGSAAPAGRTKGVEHRFPRHIHVCTYLGSAQAEPHRLTSADALTSLGAQSGKTRSLY